LIYLLIMRSTISSEANTPRSALSRKNKMHVELDSHQINGSTRLLPLERDFGIYENVFSRFETNATNSYDSMTYYQSNSSTASSQRRTSLDQTPLHPLYRYQNGVNDWSRKHCSVFLEPIENFLESQRKRENSSKRRCGIIQKSKSQEKNKLDQQRRIKELDDKINLGNILKKDKDSMRLSFKYSGNSNSSSLSNYRALLADERSRKAELCERCKSKNRKQEGAFLQRCLNCTSEDDIHQQATKPKQPRFLPNIEIYESEKIMRNLSFRNSKKKISDYGERYELLANKVLKRFAKSQIVDPQ